MIKKPVTIRTDMDMASRPIAHLVQEASQYKSSAVSYTHLDVYKRQPEETAGNMPIFWDFYVILSWTASAIPM